MQLRKESLKKSGFKKRKRNTARECLTETVGFTLGGTLFKSKTGSLYHFVLYTVSVCKQTQESLSDRAGGALRNGGGGGGSASYHQAKRIPLLKFPKMSFAWFVGTSKPLCHLTIVQCVRNRFVTMHR